MPVFVVIEGAYIYVTNYTGNAVSVIRIGWSERLA